MKVKMLETYQGVGDTGVLLDEGITVSIFESGESYEVSAKLGAWLVENRKAEEIAKVKPAKKAEAAPEPEPLPQAEIEPIMTSEAAPRRSKRAK